MQGSGLMREALLATPTVVCPSAFDCDDEDMPVICPDGLNIFASVAMTDEVSAFSQFTLARIC
jgi:hypothetical protein